MIKASPGLFKIRGGFVMMLLKVAQPFVACCLLLFTGFFWQPETPKQDTDLSFESVFLAGGVEVAPPKCNEECFDGCYQDREDCFKDAEETCSQKCSECSDAASRSECIKDCQRSYDSTCNDNFFCNCLNNCGSCGQDDFCGAGC